MDSPRPEWPHYREFENPNLSVASRCHQLVQDIFDRSRRLEDDKEHDRAEGGELVSYRLDSYIDEEAYQSLRIKECVYVASMDLPESENIALESSTPLRAYAIEMARQSYDDIELYDDVDWKAFALVVCEQMEDPVRTEICLLDAVNGRELTPLYSQKLLMILETMNASLREVMISDLVLDDPQYPTHPTERDDFYPDDYISGFSCEKCIQKRLLCTHPRPTFN